MKIDKFIKIRKLFAFLLLITVVFSTVVLTACDSGSNDETGQNSQSESVSGDPAAKDPEAPVEDNVDLGQELLIADKNVVNFTIIRPEADKTDAIYGSMVSLRAALNLVSDDAATAVKDNNKDTKYGYEILLGEVDRSESKSIDSASFGDFEWIVKQVGKKIVIKGGSGDALYEATQWFISQYITDKTEVKIEKNFEYFYESANETFSIGKNIEYIKTYGRTTVFPAYVTCDHSASGIEFTVICEGDVSIKINATGNTYYTVYINGERQEGRGLLANKGNAVYTLAEGLKKGTYTFKILKQTNALTTQSQIVSIIMNGEFKDRPKDKDLYIEFIGDSITAGVGAIPESWYTEGATGFFQDPTLGYPVLVSEKLNADFSLLGFPGWRLAGNKMTLPSVYKYVSHMRDDGLEYEFERVPDLVVINLGTNDLGNNVDRQEYKAAVSTFINQIRELYGQKVDILWVYNFMNSGYSTEMLSAVQAMGGESNGIYTLQLTRNNSGGGSHPDYNGHLKASEEILAFIKSKNLCK